jgi:hypothetical protein
LISFFFENAFEKMKPLSLFLFPSFSDVI